MPLNARISSPAHPSKLEGMRNAALTAAAESLWTRYKLKDLFPTYRSSVLTTDAGMTGILLVIARRTDPAAAIAKHDDINNAA
jgi:hypothetical protein